MEMVTFNFGSWIQESWATLAAIWLITWPFSKRTKWSQTGASLSVQRCAFVAGFFLVGSDYLGLRWLGRPFFPLNRTVQMMGLVLTMAGCGFAVWARLALGSNWSGTATIKENHELVVKGPYRLARHPIYSGILIACLGTTLAIGEWRCIVGLIVVSLGLALKVTQEERLMVATFPEAYPLYRRRVKALIPGLL
jgi:protein-S-isoprenylcysteine O-methyltransferase